MLSINTVKSCRIGLVKCFLNMRIVHNVISTLLSAYRYFGRLYFFLA